MTNPATILTISLPLPHPKQLAAIRSIAKRKVWKAGRRGGKTVGAGIMAVEGFLDGRRVLYAAPTTDQLDRFWITVCNALRPAIDAGVYKKNETEHSIDLPGTEQRVRAKTAWNADTLRGDYADLLILDEWQLMAEDTWGRVGAPMLLDNNGDAVFIYTPPSLQSRGVTKARDPQHAGKLFKRAEADTTGRWKTFVFSSHENPHISRVALAEISREMTSLSYRQEILAEDIDEAPGALWTRKIIEDNRIVTAPDCERVVVAIDPSTTAGGDEAGIIVAGAIGDHGYILEDCTLQGAPLQWAKVAVSAYHRWQADAIIAESNQGGDMVRLTIAQADPNVPVKLIHASRGKQVRAAPVSAKYEKGLVHHVGAFPMLEDELALWIPGDPSPNRLDACFVAGTMVETINGPIAIEKIRIGSKVLTRQGVRKISNAGCTGMKKVFGLMLSCDTMLTGTGNHPVYTNERGFVELCELKKSDTLLTLQEMKQYITGLSMPAQRYVPGNYEVQKKTGFAAFVVNNLLPKKVTAKKPVPVHMVTRQEVSIQPTYNLEVEGCPEYFANGVLVHNCVYSLAEIMTHTQTGFKNHDLRLWEVKGVMALNRYIVVSAANARKKSPYTAIWVIGLGQDQKYYVIDGVRDVFDLGQRVSVLFQFHKAYRPLAVAYGEDGWQVDQPYVEERQRKINYGFNVIPLGDGTPKMKPDDRIRRLAPMFSSNRIFLPGTLNKQTIKGEMRNLVADFVNEEYTVFPEGQYDDMLRAMSRILDPELNAMFPSPWYEQQESVDPEPEADY
ncbi:MAG: Hint domain-containing protein [Thermodesulfobacteriota bacterium]|nr:Hint domain-containing protein [Thermodesulfobacteriota bacterium]